MEAAHHPRVEPVGRGQVLDQFVGPLDPGAEEDEQVDAADGDDPEEEKAERAELGKRIESRTEQPIERPFDQFKSASEYRARESDHLPLRSLPGSPAT